MDHCLASIDLGSNTFRLTVGRLSRKNGHVRIQTEDRRRELVALASGLDDTLALTPDAIERALRCLRHFNQELRGFSPAHVRAVATNTFRVARNIADVLPNAEDALGYPIEVISGQEEARLIYLGVAQTLPADEAHRLVMDIGGGSTEFAIGEHNRPLQLASLALGCTSLTRAFFPDGRITEKRMGHAIEHARRLIAEIAPRFRQTGWRRAYGSSGTAKGLLAVLVENGLSPRHITLHGMNRLNESLIRIGAARLEDWAGLKAERAPVLAGGLAIMMAAFMELNIEDMRPGNGALRVGVLHDLLSRWDENDAPTG